MNICKKAINFDLSTTALKERFGDNTAVAYNAIKKFFLDNGFSHRQYSGYVSNEKMDERDVHLLAERLNEKFDWLGACLLKFDITDIGEQHALLYVFTASEVFKKSPKFKNGEK